MRILLLAAASIVLLQGCLTLAPTKGRAESCAATGLYYEGFDIVEDKKKQGNIKCIRPETPKQLCEVDATQANIVDAREVNKKWGGKRVLVGFGYALCFVPGYLMYSTWKDENEADIAKFTETRKARLQKCAVGH